MFNFGRGGEIRTHGLLYPKQARYQTAPRPDNEFIIDDSSQFVNRKMKIVLSLGDYADITYVKRFGNGRQGVPQNKGAMQFAFRYNQAAFPGHVDIVDTGD